MNFPVGSYDTFISKIHDYLRGNNFSTYQHQIAKKVDLTEQLVRLSTALTRINEQLQGQQYEKQPLLYDTLREIQEIQSNLEEIKKRQLQDSQGIAKQP
jgi:hypothetical protein